MKFTLQAKHFVWSIVLLVISQGGCSSNFERSGQSEPPDQRLGGGDLSRSAPLSDLPAEALQDMSSASTFRQEEQVSATADATQPVKLSPQQTRDIAAVVLKGYPEVTSLIRVRNAAEAKARIIEGAGRIDYDPNLGRGSAIPFLVVTLPPEKYADEAFLKSLDLSEIQITSPLDQKVKVANLTEKLNFNPSGIRIALTEVGVDQLRLRHEGRGLGEGTTIAVLDSGVDASHHVFGDRVVYWSDETQEQRTPLRKGAFTDDGRIQIEPGLTMERPAVLDAQMMGDFFVGILDESFINPDKASDRSRIGPSVDFNQNGNKTDRMLLLLVKDADTGTWVTYCDSNADLKFSEEELQQGFIDFNQWRALQHNNVATPYQGFISFKSAARLKKYPVLLTQNARGEPAYFGLGVDLRGHGTHVAGIAAGGGGRIEGAAPKAQIMSIKVCPSENCSSSAIIRGLLKAFYNEQGLIPDIVNISLGSQQGYNESLYDTLIRDLSAKFGSVFFVAASNSGPGYRSINEIGASSPAVLVGAHASRTTLKEHYNFHEGLQIQTNHLLKFSSVGPSYTGELRPNLVAPGSALSSAPLTAEHSTTMLEGTSMAAPMAAGATAAMISLLRNAPEYKKFNDLVNAKRAAVYAYWRGRTVAAAPKVYSLASAALGFRAALEDSSSKDDFRDYSTAQIGHGLMNVNRAYDLMILRAGAMTASAESDGFSAMYASFKFNLNNGDSRVYSREVNAKKFKTIEISVNEDGEESQIDIEALEVEPITVKLTGVEETDEDGRVLFYEAQNSTLAFGIGTSMAQQESRQVQVVISNSNKAKFISIRHLDRMKEGHTYVARYDLYQFGNRVNTVLDVVHKPFIMSDVEESFYLPSINAETLSASHAIARQKKAIKATQYHRYPIAVLGQDTFMEVSLGIAHEVEGLVQLTVYDPDGHRVGIRDILKINGKSTRDSKVFLRVETGRKKGVYEIVIANSQGDMLVDTNYDLLIRKVKIVSSWTTLKLKPAETKAIVFSDLAGQEHIANFEAKLTRRMLSIGDIALIPGHRTFKQIVLPESLRGRRDIMVRMAEQKTPSSAFSCDVDKRLYHADDGGKAEVAYRLTYPMTGGDGVFYSVQWERPLYAAVECPASPSDGPAMNTVSTKVALEVDLVERISEQLTIVRDSSSDAYANVYRVTAPDELQIKNATLAGKIRITLVSGGVIEVPVEVSE